MMNTPSLTPTESIVLDQLRLGPKSVNEIRSNLRASYHAVYNPMQSLVAKGFAEVDVNQSAFGGSSAKGGRNVYRLKREPNEGIEIFVNANGERRQVSFNVFLEQLAKSAKSGRFPAIATAWPNLLKCVALLGVCAAKEFQEEGSITQKHLLEIRSDLQKYGDTLQDQFSLVQQLITDERLWNPDLLKSIFTKTDRYFTPNDIREFARDIFDRFTPESEVLDTENAEVMENENE